MYTIIALIVVSCMIHAQETTFDDNISHALHNDASYIEVIPKSCDTIVETAGTQDTDACMDVDAQDSSTNIEPSEDELMDSQESTADIDSNEQEFEATPEIPIEERTIRNIIVEGAHHIPVEAILDRIPYRTGERFNPDKSRILIRTLYYELQRFKRIDLEVDTVGDNELDVYIIVEEKKPLLGVTFTGLHKVTAKDINEKINFAEIPALDEQEIEKYARMINKLYIEKGYLHTEIKPEIIETDGKLNVVFHITEHPKSIIRRIDFQGNEYVSGKTLRNIMFTREDWIMSFMDKSGTYNPEWLERDKHMIEQYYQNSGFMNAKVYDTQIIPEDNSNYITIVLQVDEGHKYQFGTVTVDGANLLSEEFLLEHMPVQAGNDYSREAIVESIKFLEFMFGDLGHLYTHIEPSIQPNDETRTVDVHFAIDPGKRVFLNKLTIRGNKKTRDKIIRRNIFLQEGGIITNNLMEVSKTKVESLGYFDTRDGVNWKTTRISEEEADLDLVVKEVKTGNANLKIGFGGPEIIGENKFRDYVNQLMTGVSVEGNIADTNVAGTGIRFNVTGKLSTKEQDVLVNLTQPWLFDKPIYGSIDGFHRRAAYDQLRFAFAMNEQRSSGSFTLGVVTVWRTVPFFNDTYIRANFGFDRLVYDKNPQAIRPAIPEPQATIARDEYQVVLNKLFYPGACPVHFPWLNIQLGQDKKNHPMHPSRGYTWMMRGIFAFPSFDSDIGYAKWDLDVNWFTPLINEHDLVLRLHGYAGIAKPFNNRFIPYRELFHIGGPASIRGYLFGQIGPQFTVFEDGFNLGDSIGAENTVFFNAELIFPILPDMSLKALAFYDGGAGWKNPYACDISPEFLRNNDFDYRHAVGIGLRLLNPMPMKIDWGFKLDPRRGEPAYEVHFAMGYDW